MKNVFKTVPMLIVVMSLSSAHAGIKNLFGLVPEGRKIEASAALDQLRSEFSAAGIDISVQGPLLNGNTPDGDKCTVDVKLLSQFPGYANIGDILISVGDQEVVFNLSPKLSDYDEGTYEVRQLKSAANAMSLSAKEDHIIQVDPLFGQDPVWKQVGWTRTIEVTKDGGKIASIHIQDKDESAGEATCILN